MSEKLWDLANLITGFAVAQSLAMIYAIARWDPKYALSTALARPIALVLTVLFNGVYVLFMWWCEQAGRPSNPAGSVHIWKVVTYGRIATIAAFALLLLPTLSTSHA
jgi:hypothetical protein